jgi:hypothetical protein
VNRRSSFSDAQIDHLHNSPRIFLVQVSSSGDEAVPVNVPMENAYIADVSPDGSELLVSTVSQSQIGAPLWSMPLPAGSPRRLAP